MTEIKLPAEKQLEQQLSAVTEAAAATQATIDTLNARVSELEEQDHSRQRRLKLLQVVCSVNVITSPVFVDCIWNRRASSRSRKRITKRS